RAAYRCRHADLVHGGFDGGDGIAQRHAGRQVERNGVGDQKALVIDRERRRALLETRDLGERNHGLLLGRDGRAGRGGALAGGADRIGRGIARGLRVGGGGRNTGSDDGPRDRVGRLRASDRAAGGGDVDVLQGFRVLPVARRDL